MALTGMEKGPVLGVGKVGRERRSFELLVDSPAAALLPLLESGVASTDSPSSFLKRKMLPFDCLLTLVSESRYVVHQAP
jgi:hypothetical protein